MRVLKEIKHKAFVGFKALSPKVENATSRILDSYFHTMNRYSNYEFNPARYRRSFIVRKFGAGPVAVKQEVPRNIYCFWTGDNELTENRVRNLNISVQRSSLPIKLITPKNIERDFLVEGFPLHPAYEYLSLVHRSDYLRAYMAAYRGGGYMDIKEIDFDPKESYEEFVRSDKWYVGGQHHRSRDVAHMTGNLGWDIRKYHQLIPANGFFFSRPGTPLALEWMREVDRLLDYMLPQLVEFPGDTWGANTGYPLSWNRLLNQIHHPLCLKYHQHILLDERLTYPSQDYK